MNKRYTYKRHHGALIVKDREDKVDFLMQNEEVSWIIDQIEDARSEEEVQIILENAIQNYGRK